MIPGTTPTHTFTLPFSTSILAAARVTYKQAQKIVLQKELEDFALADNQATVTLTQEECLKFDSNVTVQIQMKVRTEDGKVLVSEPKSVSVGILLDKELI